MATTDRGARVRAVQAAGAAALLAVPAAAAASAADVTDPPSPREAALRAPIAGHVTVAGQMRAARRSDEQQRLIRVAARLRDRVAHVRRERPDDASLRDEAPAALHLRITRLRRELRDARHERAMERVAVPPALQAIAACESGGDPAAVGGGGLYRGKYQFDAGTWASVGGSGDPAAASEAEQDTRAARLYARAGATPWPLCGG